MVFCMRINWCSLIRSMIGVRLSRPMPISSSYVASSVPGCVGSPTVYLLIGTPLSIARLSADGKRARGAPDPDAPPYPIRGHGAERDEGRLMRLPRRREIACRNARRDMRPGSPGSSTPRPEGYTRARPSGLDEDQP